jgi:Co/Zn/Cd efflux system component
MPACCSGACRANQAAPSPRYRRALWIALVLNVLMFGVEIVGSLYSGSVSLLADAVDFAGDAANYGLSLAVLSMGLAWRARAAWVKGMSMGAYGVLVLAKTAWAMTHGQPPEPISMGLVALLALAVNLGVALLLYAFRNGDADMRSVWLCSRNDAIGNVAVMLAALGVFGTGSAWPDLLVAGVMASLALAASLSVTRQARRELREVAGSA